MRLITLLLVLLQLLADVAAQASTTLTLGVPTASATTLACGSYAYYTVTMTDPCQDLVVSVAKTAGEPNIYVSKKVQFPTKASMSWAAFAYGSYSVSISHWSPNSSPGVYYIGVLADCSAQSSAATYTITASSVTNNDGTDIYLNSALTQQVTIAPGQYKSFRFCMPAHTAIIGTADPSVVFVGGTNGQLTNKLIVTSVISGALAKGMSLSGVGITSPCTILYCQTGAGTTFTEPYTAPTSTSVAGSMTCTLSSRQSIPGPTYFTVSAVTAATATNMTATLVSYTPASSAFGRVAIKPLPAAGMTVADFSSANAKTPRSIQSYTDGTTAGTGTISVTKGTAWGVASTTTTYTAGLKITGAKFNSGPSPNFAVPSEMLALRAQKVGDWVGDQCADVVVSWTMVDAPGTPHYPDVILSRTSTAPQVNSYAWRRTDYNAYGSYTIDAQKVMSRDNHGFLSGSWYLSLYGYCAYSTANALGVSQTFQGDDDLYSGKCRTNDLPTTVSFSVAIVPRVTGDCANANLQPNAQTANFGATPALSGTTYTKLTSGIKYSGSVNSRKLANFRIRNPNGCNSMNVLLTTTSGKLLDGSTAQMTDYSKAMSAEISIGKWPNILPTLADKSWSGYSSFNQNFTIDAWDPALDGGSTCGAAQDQPCYYYISVFGYNSTETLKSVNFDLTITLSLQHRAFGVPQLNQIVAAGGSNQYKFCLQTNSTLPYYSTDARINLYSYTDSCACPGSYSDLQLVVSKSDAQAAITDNVWRIGHGNKPASGTSTLDLSPTDPDVRPGTYYLSVLGYCSNADQCLARGGPCSCAPCANLPSSPYALSVHAVAASDSNPLGSCALQEPYNTFSYGQAQCCYPLAALEADVTSLKTLSAQTLQIANGGVGLAVLLWIGVFVAALWALYRYVYGRLYPHQALSTKEVELAMRGDFDVEPGPGRLSAHGSSHSSSGAPVRS